MIIFPINNITEKSKTMITDIRKSPSPFYDDANFPRGFSRSGEFSVTESNILSQYGNTLKKLADGSLMPDNPEEKRFTEAADGKVEVETQIEKTWKKYISLTTTPKVFHSIYGSHRPNEEVEYDVSEGFDDL